MKFYKQNCNAFDLTGTIPYFLQPAFIIPEKCDKNMYGFIRKNKKTPKSFLKT